MKHIFFAALAFAVLASLPGCNNGGSEKLTSVDNPSTGSTATSGTADGPGGETGSSGLPTSGGLGTSLGSGTEGSSAIGGTSTPLNNGSAPTTNPALDSSGKEVKFDGQNPAPEGRVWCDNCHGHLPKEDAVALNGKTLCMACAEELKNKK